MDVGTSGGVWGKDRGYCMMIGGEAEVVQHLDPIFAALAPGLGDSRGRRVGRRSGARPKRAIFTAAPTAPGDFVKMVHNGIEYGIMAAYAEGLNILKHANMGKHMQDVDAETAPATPRAFPVRAGRLRHRRGLARGSVIASWLLDLTAQALFKNPELADFSGRVSDSGEGRWTIQAAIDEGVPARVLSAALFERFSSRRTDDYADQVLSAMRFAFGGHLEKKA